MTDLKKFITAIREVAKGKSPSKVSATLKIPRSTIRGWIERAKALSLTYERIRDMSPAELKNALLTTSRPISGSAIDWESLLAECAECRLTVQELYERYRARCTGSEKPMGRSSFYEVYKEKYEAANPVLKRLFMHNSFEPASVTMIDYSGKTAELQNTDGSRSTVQIFVGVLGCSGLIFCCATPGQTRRDWLSGIVSMFEYFEGVTDEIWLDNTTSLINHPDKALPDVSPEFQNFCDYYDVFVHPVAPAEPTYKGLVENAVRQVQRYVLRPIAKRPFFDLKSLNIELSIKLKILNDSPMTTHSKSSRHERYLSLEQSLLKPLPRLPYSPDMKVIRRKVLKGDQFRLGDIRYNVPWGHSGQYLSIIVDSEQRLLRCFSAETGEFLFDTQIRNPGSGDEPMRPEFVVPELRYLALTRQQLVEEISELGAAAALLAQHLARQSNSRACTHLREVYRQADKMAQKDFLEICEEALRAPEVNLQAFRKARDAFEKDKKATAIKRTAATTSITPKDPKQVRGAEYFNDNGEKKNAS